MLTPNPRILALSVYKPRIPRDDITLRLDSNEGRPPPDLLQRLVETASTVLSQYPNTRRLEERLSQRMGVTPDALLVTAGADDALDRICRAVLAPGRNIVMPAPTFEMLPRYAHLAGGSVSSVPWLGGPLPTRGLIEAADESTAVVAVVSPNNPTGSVASPDDLVQLREALPHALLLVDLAYGELADVDLTEAALALPDTIVVRTLSKAWGLAGLRVGYVAGPEHIIEWLRRVGNPYAVSAVSIALAEAQLDDDRAMRAYVQRVKEQRRELFSVLERGGVGPLPSQGNFVFCEPPAPRQLRDALGDLGIGVRAWAEDSELARFLRITCPGDDEGMQRLLKALSEVLS